MEVYRAVVDLNRAPDDVPPRNRDGVIKSHTCFDVEVYRPGSLPDEKLQKLLLDRYYHPYHRRLQSWLGRDDLRMGVDCHSMVAVAPPIEEDAGTPRPLICLGNLGDAAGETVPEVGRATCSAEMLRFVGDEFERALRHEDVDLEVPATVTHNVPFRGGYITRQMGNKTIPFFQVEMSRALYLAAPYFDAATLEIDDRRVRDLNAKVWQVLRNTVRNL
jgi:formiminoglutamase